VNTPDPPPIACTTLPESIVPSLEHLQILIYPTTLSLAVTSLFRKFNPSNTGEANPDWIEPDGVSLASSERINQPKLLASGYWS
jgi:hypothetical protein